MIECHSEELWEIRGKVFWCLFAAAKGGIGRSLVPCPPRDRKICDECSARRTQEMIRTSQEYERRSVPKSMINSASSAPFPNVYLLLKRSFNIIPPTLPDLVGLVQAPFYSSPLCSPFFVAHLKHLIQSSWMKIHHTVPTVMAYFSRRVVSHFLLPWYKCECKEAFLAGGHLVSLLEC